ncbi:peptidylprolyl isomerase [bacterium]|nr:peptidylprolyl isomerase [bacterium]
MIKTTLLALSLAVALVSLTACGGDGLVPAADSDTPVAVLETDIGNIWILLHDSVNPDTVDNFTKLIAEDFYDGIGFHRVEKSHVIQAGCPVWDNPALAGSGGPGWQIDFEDASLPHLEGAVGMARAVEYDSAGSQFYICLSPRPHLDGEYVIFGTVIAGMEIVHEVYVGVVINDARVISYGEFLELSEAATAENPDPLGIRPIEEIKLASVEELVIEVEGDEELETE